LVDSVVSRRFVRREGPLGAGDTEEARNERVQNRLATATEDLGKVLARLQLEGDDTLVEAYRRVTAHRLEYTSGLALPRGPARNLAGVLTELNADVESILKLAKSRLDELCKPI